MQSYSTSSNLHQSSDVITVTALNQAVAQLLEQNIPLTWISGEISNFTRASSGHWYFTLKDSGAQVRAVMFKGRAQYASFMPREGDKVEVRATVGLYAPRGDFQINVEAIRKAGVGNLYEAFLQLKAKLAEEGLFDIDRKREMPYFVRQIGIVTSLQAAALRDVLTTIKRRAPHVEVILYPCPVQGEGAGAKIAQAIATASAREECDVLIVCRGGGSIEDLWAFNEEIVARTIANCSMPVISGVGHETDFTICDFVADLRAATPTAAAELAIIAREDWLGELKKLQQHMHKNIRRTISTQTQTLDWTAQRLQSPLTSLANKREQIQQCAQRLRYAAHVPLQKSLAQLAQSHARLRYVAPDTQTAKLQCQHLQQQLKKLIQTNKMQHSNQLQNLSQKLEVLNPQRTLERGYVILKNTKNELIRSGHDIQANQELILHTASDQTHIGVHALSLPIPNRESAHFIKTKKTKILKSLK